MTDVSIYIACVPGRVKDLPALEALVAPAELERAGRILPAADRARFLLARALLRSVLGGETGADPRALAIETLPHGKPVLRENPGNLHFNLSHAHRYVMLAVGRDRELGVDIEYLGRPVATLELAQRYCTPMENAILRPMAGTARKHQFLRFWTRKEAFLKATGRGLTVPLRTIDVSARPGDEDEDPVVRVRIIGDPAPASPWAVEDLAAPPRYAAALAYEGEKRRVGRAGLPGALRAFEPAGV